MVYQELSGENCYIYSLPPGTISVGLFAHQALLSQNIVHAFHSFLCIVAVGTGNIMYIFSLLPQVRCQLRHSDSSLWSDGDADEESSTDVSHVDRADQEEMGAPGIMGEFTVTPFILGWGVAQSRT